MERLSSGRNCKPNPASRTPSGTNRDTDSSVATPAHEPKGAIIFQSSKRKIIRHGDRITKINARGIRPSEADAMRFVREHTTIPVPRVHATTPTSITMDFVEGTSLREGWNDLSGAERAAVSAQLRDYIDQLRALRGSYIGGFGGRPAVDVRHFFFFEGGPFKSEAEWNNFLVEDLLSKCPETFPYMVKSQLRTDHDIVLTHGDLVAKNILVRNGRIVAIIDWARAGYYPEYTELLNPLRGPDWSIGYYNALVDLFPRRYDAMFFADQYITHSIFPSSKHTGSPIGGFPFTQTIDESVRALAATIYGTGTRNVQSYMSAAPSTVDPYKRTGKKSRKSARAS